MAFTPSSSIAPGSVTIVGALPLPTGAATETTLKATLGTLSDVALTAILQRDQLEAGG